MMLKSINRKLKGERFMLKRLLYCLTVLAVLVTLGVSYAWRAESAGKPGKKVEGGGTKGQIAKWVDTNEIGDSVITEDNGQVAIGNVPSPIAKFLVYGAFDIPNAAIRGNNISDGRGIEGSSVGGIGINGLGGTVGVNGISFSSNPNDAAVRGISHFGIPYAGDFSGNVRVTGMLTKGGGSFKIDHPLDPKNKYLSHSFVESPDMMNIYNGNVTTDERGDAVINLPNYFDALNRDFRYQLTVIGDGFAQAIVAEKIKGNQFKIKTDKPKVEVSWQVTGIRKDKFAEENRIRVETEKPASERGTLQN